MGYQCLEVLKEKKLQYPLVLSRGLMIIALLSVLFLTNCTIKLDYSNTPSQLSIGSIMTREIDSMDMVYIPAGTFTMGSKFSKDDAKPRHQIYLDAYWIDKYEVSNAQYARCVEAGICENLSVWSISGYKAYDSHSDIPEYNDYPVNSVNWYQAQAYCEWVGGSLPTEAQWEKAARGTDKRFYPWGNKIPTCKLANKDGCVDGGTSPVTDYQEGASPYGALNMAGNVSEWVTDWYKPYERERAKFPFCGNCKVIRGGSYLYGSNSEIRTYSRNGWTVSMSNVDIGFRCIYPVEP